MVMKRDRIQSNFLKNQSKIAKNAKMAIELDKDFLSKSANVLQYYIQLLKHYECNSPNDNILELKIIKVFNILITVLTLFRCIIFCRKNFLHTQLSV